MYAPAKCTNIKSLPFKFAVNHCISNPCKNGANCTSSWSDYQCSCLPGYTGVNCETSKLHVIKRPNKVRDIWN